MYVRYAVGSMIPKLERLRLALGLAHLGRMFQRTSFVRCAALVRTNSLLNKAKIKASASTGNRSLSYCNSSYSQM